MKLRNCIISTCLSFFLIGCHYHNNEKRANRVVYSWVKLKNNVNFTATTMCEYKNCLYTGGLYDIAVKRFPSPIAKWDDSSWTYIGNMHDTTFTWVYTMTVYKGELYVGADYGVKGNDDERGGIFKWDGLRWHKIGELVGVNTIMNNKVDTVNKEFEIGHLLVYNDELYLGGQFSGVDRVHSSNIIRWDGTEWKPIVSGSNKTIIALGVYKNQLYVSGFFDTIGGKPIYHIARWDGHEFYPMGKRVSIHAEIYNFCEYEDTLFVSGHFFDSVGGLSVGNIAKWDGYKWSNFSRGTDNSGLDVGPFFVYEHKLIFSGYFDSICGIQANNIALYNDNHWEAMGKLPCCLIWSFAKYHNNIYALDANNDSTELGGVFKLSKQIIPFMDSLENKQEK